MTTKKITIFDKIIDWIFINFIRFYQKTLSPDKWFLSLWLKGKVCAHEPHCSQYAIDHIQRYWRKQSLIPVSDRVLNCVPSYNKKYDPVSYRVVFFSSANIGISFLDQLIKDDRFDIVWVVTQPDQPSWRWLKLQSNIVKSWTQEKYPDIQVITPNKINPDKSQEWKQFASWLAEKSPDYIVVIAYGKIIPQSILDTPKIWPINIHWSLLPAYRGASPIQSVFLDWEKETGITIMLMDSSLDTGDILSQHIVPIKFDYTVKDIITLFEEQWPAFLNKILISYAKWDINSIPQDNKLSNTTSKIIKEDGQFDIFDTDMEIIYNKYRAYYLRPKIRFTYKDKRYIVENILLDKPLFEANKNKPLFEEHIVDEYHIHPAIKELIIKQEWKKSISYKDRFHSLQN